MSVPKLPLMFCLLALTSAFGASPNSNTSGQALAPTFEQPVLAIQPFAPLQSMKDYLCAFHIYADNAHRQVEAHHYCSVVGTVAQCAIFHNNTADARLMGIEYLIPAEVFATLPQDEQQLWHSHIYEVKSGMLQAPGIPNPTVQPLLEQLVNMYGKTFHTWQVDKNDTLPLGAPQLMMSFTGNGQLNPELQRQYEQHFNFSMAQAAADRANITPNPAAPLPNADFPWRSGKAWQTFLKLVPFVGQTAAANNTTTGGAVSSNISGTSP